MSATHEQEARELGREAGRAAGSWAAGGNTGAEHIRRVLALMEDGDPRADDFLPDFPNLSGGWADDPTPSSLARYVTGDDDPDGELVDELAYAWEDGVGETFWEACEATLRGCLPDDEDTEVAS